MASHLPAGGRSRQRKRLQQLKKPEAERRRRARIAMAVERLRMLLMEEGAAPPLPAPCTPPHLHHLSMAPRRGAWQRLEKVVVLELTVAHLRRLAAHHPGDGRQQFREGYRRCQEEVLRFLGCTAAVQPHVAERLWQQLTHQTIDASRQDAHTPVELLDNDSTSRKPPRPTSNEAHLPRLTLTVEPLEPRPVTSRISLPRTPCSPDPIPPHHAPYAHTHWKKCLRPRVGACFWRPW